jgi:hypothetical protein
MPSTPESSRALRAPRRSIAQDLYQHIFDRGSSFARITNKPLSLCRQWYLQSAPADAAVLDMLCSGHLPEPPLNGLPGHLDSPAPTNPYTSFICTWCHSDMMPPKVPSSARNLPWLHIVHRLLLCCACSPGHHPVSQCFSALLLLTSDWYRYHCCLDILFNHTSGPASSCVPSPQPFTDFLCSLADPYGFEDPPPGIPVEARTHCWLDFLATARFLCGVSPTPSPMTPPLLPAHACYTLSTADSSTAMDSVDCSHASALAGSLSETPSWCHSTPLLSPGVLGSSGVLRSF